MLLSFPLYLTLSLWREKGKGNITGRTILERLKLFFDKTGINSYELWVSGTLRVLHYCVVAEQDAKVCRVRKWRGWKFQNSNSTLTSRGFSHWDCPFMRDFSRKTTINHTCRGWTIKWQFLRTVLQVSSRLDAKYSKVKLSKYRENND